MARGGRGSCVAWSCRAPMSQRLLVARWWWGHPGRVRGLSTRRLLEVALGRQRELVGLRMGTGTGMGMGMGMVLRMGMRTGRRREMGPYGRFRQRAAQWPSSPPLSTMW